ncbi:MAG: hypothetical protein ABSB28_10580 [Candidatus Bathyarchaeia archaeon]
MWASVLVTVVLVIINTFYAMQTRQTIKEMEKARKADFLPHVRAELSFLGPVFLILKATNFGKGPATDIRTEITFLPSNEKRVWQQAIMSPNEFIRILLPDGNLAKVLERSAEITAKGEYKDVFGQTFKIDERMDVKAFIDEATQLRPILERDLARLVEDIKDKLDGIERELHDIRLQLETRRIAETEEL